LLNKKSIKDINVAGKTILLRADFNVPLSGHNVTDDTRIRAVLPTLEYLIKHNAKVVMASHLGRPKGEYKPELKLDPVADRLSELLGRPVAKAGRVRGPEVNEMIEKLKEGELLLLENVRFESGEEKNDPELAARLTDKVDLFVNDAFGTAHRAHASTSGVAAHVPAVAGLLMKKEIETLSRCLEDPPRPMVAILGGAKVSDKINVIRRFLELADNLLIGGGMANTFLAAQGYDLKNSFYEKEQLDLARSILEESGSCRCRFALPDDLVATAELKDNSPYEIVKPDRVPDQLMAVDIGPESAARFGRVVSDAGMVVWNGPLGVFETPPFHKGTETVARAVAESRAYSIAGGGDLVAALEALSLSSQFSFISTGGGAALEFWEGKKLPGIEVLEDK